MLMTGLTDMVQGINWVQFLPFLIGGAGLIANAVSGSLHGGSRRRIQEMSRLHGVIPEASRTQLERAIGAEVGRYVETVERRANRHLDGPMVGAVLLVFAVGVAILWGLLWLVVSWGWWMWIPTVTFGIAFVLLMSAGSMSVVYYGDESPREERRKKKGVGSPATA